MSEALSVLFKIGRSPNLPKPEPDALQQALQIFLHDILRAGDLAADLGIPSNTQVKYEIRIIDDLSADDPSRMPLHMSIRGPKHVAEGLHDKFAEIVNKKTIGLADASAKKLLDDLGFPSEKQVDFKFYVRSPTGEKFTT